MILYVFFSLNRRWKVLCPEYVPLLQEARKKQRSIIGCNFVDRESERPAITLNDFLPLPVPAPKSDVGASNLRKKAKSRYAPFNLPFFFLLILNNLQI